MTDSLQPDSQPLRADSGELNALRMPLSEEVLSGLDCPQVEVGALRAGVARRVISPPKGVPLLGYPRLLSNKGVGDDLSATALVLSDERRELAVVAVDLVFINESMVDQIRERVSPIEVVLCCSHTHSGPLAYASERASRLTRNYLETLVEDVVDAVHEAAGRIVPAQARYSSGEGDIAVNRRKRMPNGTIQPGEHPDGPVDRSLQVLSIISADGDRLATVINYACHPTAFGPENPYSSADWVGVMRARVEQELGGIALFLQGASGNLIPKGSYPFHMPWQLRRSRALVERLGARMADCVVNAVSSNSEQVECVPLEISRRDVWLPSEVPATTEHPPKNYREAILDAIKIPRVMAFAVDFFAEQIFPWKFPDVSAKDGVWSIPMRASVVRVGDLAIATAAAELFTELGMEIKAGSPAKHTLIASVTDGSVLYIPTRAEQALGGFEVDLPWTVLKMPGNFAPNVGEITTETLREMLRELWRT